MTKKSNNFSVFGTRPRNAICLPDVPYSVRLNCKDGGRHNSDRLKAEFESLESNNGKKALAWVEYVHQLTKS